MRDHYLVICPEYPPDTSGLAGHTRAFAEELARANAVTVLTSARTGRPFDTGHVRVLATVRSWRFPHLFEALRTIASLAPNRIVLQYLPFLYNARGGINFSICFFVLLARLRGYRIDLVCHELYYPWLPRPKAMVMFCSHVAMLLLLGLAADRVFASTELFAKRAGRILFWRRRVFHLPVGSNMPWLPVAQDEIERFRRSHRLMGKRVLTCFGTSHPTRDHDLVLSAICDWAERIQEPVSVLWVGETKDSILAQLSPETRTRAEQRITALGKVDELRFALAMHATDVAIAYFRDGASTRRSSLMATLAYAVPTVSSRSPATEAHLEKISDLTLLPAEPNAFRADLPEVLTRLFSEPRPRNREPSVCYAKLFGWESIVRRYQDPDAPMAACESRDRFANSTDS